MLGHFLTPSCYLMEVSILKKIHFYILSLIIALLCLAGCKVQTVEQYNAQNANEKSVDDSNEKVIPIKEEEKKAKKQKEDSTTHNEGQLKTTKTEQKDGQDKKKTNISKKEINSSNKETNSFNKETNIVKKETVTTKKEINKPKKEINQSRADSQTSSKKETVAKKSHPLAKSSTDSKVTVKEKKKYVTITVRVDTLLKEANYKKLDESLQNEKYVPKSGVIVPISKYQILNDDDSAWNITVRALKEHHILFEYQGANDTKYGSVYIEAINHLGEMDAGKLSGWMYSVNGKNPGLGSSSYTVKDGDKIVWQYTVEQGKDIGL